MGLDPGVVAAVSKRATGSVSLVEDDGSETRRIFGANA
jgi:hypothetical protein